MEGETGEVRKERPTPRAFATSFKDRTWPDFDPAFHGIERLRGLV